MKCLRCGYCCYFYEVIIVSKEAIRPDGSIDFEDESSYQSKHTGEQCPHLLWDNDTAVCSIHRYEWFCDTPCGQHTQIESTSTPCRLGKHIRSTGVSIRDGA